MLRKGSQRKIEVRIEGQQRGKARNLKWPEWLKTYPVGVTRTIGLEDDAEALGELGGG